MSQRPHRRIGSSVVILLGVVMLFASRSWQIDRGAETKYRLFESRTAKKQAKQTEQEKGIVPAVSQAQPPASDEASLPQPKVDPEKHPFSKSSNPEIRELARLVACAQSRECDYDQSTPISYDRELSSLITNQIKRLQSKNPSPEDTRVARAFMTYPDDFVKSAAMVILANSEASPENMSALLTGLRDSSSGPLYVEALDLLERYKGQPELDKFLVESVQAGGHFASAELAKHSLRFLSQENAPMFKGLLNQLPSDSLSREYLEANLREFKRLQEGG